MFPALWWILCFFFFFFKQKTAYEITRRDWSSDVCSSDLFKTGPRTRAVIGALGSAAIEGPLISWVADHRKHHAFSDEEGDPHSPHVGHGEGVWAQFKGFFHAHVGWLFIHTQRGSKTRFAPDLLKDPVARFIDRTFVLWALIGLAIPFG